VTRALTTACIAAALAGCGDDKPTCPLAFGDGDASGHADPLGAGPGEARAGRIRGDQLPAVPSGLVTWQDGDFVIANDKVALVIEDAGDSDLYDPWGGRPVGLARVVDHALVEPSNFGEVFLLTGRSTIVTERVSVIADGSNGGPAIVRARGKLHPLPFFESLVGVVYADTYADIEAAIDYELAPGDEHVNVRIRYASARPDTTNVPSTMHAVMFSSRTSPRPFQPDLGFDDLLASAPYIAFPEDGATSWAYVPGEGTLASSIATSGFLGAFSAGFPMAGCGTTDRLHARIVIGGPGLDGVVAAAHRVLGVDQEEIAGVITRASVPAAGVHVHAIGAGPRYLTRATTDSLGRFRLHVPTGVDVQLETFSRGDPNRTVPVGIRSLPVTIDLPPQGAIHVTATENGLPVPARVQIVMTDPPSVPDNYGEPPIAANRLHVAYPEAGEVALPAPPGDYEVIVSRGFEYELVRENVSVTAGATIDVTADLEHVVDTTGVQCADFHVHTWRSNDSGDNSLEKVRQAVADGVELPVRSDHEWVDDFESEIAQLGVEKHAVGFGSVELTSFELWGHMGVFPVEADPSRVNAGAPTWQTFPTSEAPDAPFETLSPPIVFDSVRARPEAPVIIINHPRGSTNYFGYVGYDPATGLASEVADWDTKFTLVEFFNNAGWQSNRGEQVEDWIGLLRAGRKIFAVGSSDSHTLSSSPVGYPRTCIALGTDDPRALTASAVRDQLAAGHTTVSGGIFVSAKVGIATSGDTVGGAGSPMDVDVTVQAATWIDVDTIEVIVDGVTVDTIPVLPGDADPSNPVIRWKGQVPVQVQATGGFVIVAAYGGTALAPVHAGKVPFGVTNPIFVVP
jgi:hypothetical protein